VKKFGDKAHFVYGQKWVERIIGQKSWGR